MSALYLIVRVAGERAVVPADAVDAVIECGAVTPVPRAAVNVLGVSALRGRVVTLIDTATALGLGGVPALGEAVLLTVGGHAYALVVDAIEDVVTAEAVLPPPAGLATGWANAAIGAIELGEELLLVLDPAALVAPPAARAA